MEQTLDISDTQAKDLYRVAGAAALLIILAGLTDAITSMGMEARDNSTVSIIEWFTLFQTNQFAAFSRLGVINITTLSLCIPIYLAFMQAFRQHRPALGMLAPVLFFIGIAVYISSNTVFSLFAISQQYASADVAAAAADAEAQKPLLEAAGRALLVQGADLTPGTFRDALAKQIFKAIRKARTAHLFSRHPPPSGRLPQLGRDPHLGGKPEPFAFSVGFLWTDPIFMRFVWKDT